MIDVGVHLYIANYFMCDKEKFEWSLIVDSPFQTLAVDF